MGKGSKNKRGKQKVTLAQMPAKVSGKSATDWDMGTQTLAALGNIPGRIIAFKTWLRNNPKIAAPKLIRDGEIEVMETEDQALLRCARRFKFKDSYTVTEDAEFYDEESGKMVNPNGVKRARRIDLVEHYHRKGVIDRRQMLAGLALRVAFEGTQRTAPAIKKVQVDSSPKPDANIEIMIDRISRFADVQNGLCEKHREILGCVVLDNNHPAALRKYRGRRYLLGIEAMQEALSSLADQLEL